MDNLVARALNILYTTTGSLDKCRITLHKYYTDMLNSLCTDVTQIFHDDTEIMQETKSEEKFYANIHWIPLSFFQTLAH